MVRRNLELYSNLRTHLGEQTAGELMEAIGDRDGFATKLDLGGLESRLITAMHNLHRTLLLWMVGLFVTTWAGTAALFLSTVGRQ